jgi:hypothetical protein
MISFLKTWHCYTGSVKQPTSEILKSKKSQSSIKIFVEHSFPVPFMLTMEDKHPSFILLN